MKYLLRKSFVREFPLVHVQMWGQRYSKEFLGEHTPDIPYYVFLLKDGLVTAYRNISGQTETINKIIKTKINTDSAFIKNFAKEKSKKLKNLKDFLKRKSISQKEFVDFLDELFDNWQLHYIAQFVPLDKNRFSEKIRNEAFFLRETIDTIITDCWHSIIPSLKKLFPEMGDLVFYISWDEVKNFKFPDLAELQNRAKMGVILFNGEIVDEAGLVGLKTRYDFALEEDCGATGKSEFPGQIASAGLAIGKVRKILKEKDISSFERGEILVSYMTMPVFMPAIKKAAALVTDEGGITSHATIIARELKKPCIIGTKIATKVLKDGDLVEVDANNGTVKILEWVN